MHAGFELQNLAVLSNIGFNMQADMDIELVFSCYRNLQVFGKTFMRWKSGCWWVCEFHTRRGSVFNFSPKMCQLPLYQANCTLGCLWNWSTQGGQNTLVSSWVHEWLHQTKFKERIWWKCIHFCSIFLCINRMDN